MLLASVLLIEDDSFTRSTLAALISQRGFNLVGAVDNAEEALLLQKLHKPEVVISDVDLGPGPTGIDIVTALREIDPQIGVILLTSFSDPRFIKDSTLELPKGTLYFTKSKLSDVTKLLTAILQVKNRPLFHSNNRTKNEINLTENQIDILRSI